MLSCLKILTPPLRVLLATGGLFALALTGAVAQERVLSPEQFEDASLQYRTALHYDPLLEATVENLIRLYREADRVDELVGLYRSHIEQYPKDAGAKSVLIQVLSREKREGAGELVTSAVTLHPEVPSLQYLLFRFLEEKGDERALDALSKAIDLEANVERRRQWLEELLKLSEGDEARKLAGAQLSKLLLVEGQAADHYLTLAKLMQRYLFWDLSLQALKLATTAGLPPDGEVEASVMEATALGELGRGGEAVAILEALLGRLASDHWRRREILAMRLSVVATEAERSGILDEYRKAYEDRPESESAALDYAEILLASERQTAAIEVILRAAAELSNSRVIEARALELLLSGNEPAALEAFLVERLEIDPERADLRFQLVKVRYLLGKDGEAEQDFKAVVAGLEPAELSARILELQRYLRSIDRIEAAGGYLERYVRNYPDRLDVARELAEIYLSQENTAGIDSLMARLDVSGAAPEAVVELVQFLMVEGFLAPARALLTNRLKSEPSHFELGLLLIAVHGELGEEAETLAFAPKMRELADTPERYSRWLAATVSAHRKLGTEDRFFAAEQARFSFDSGDWPEEKVEKFLSLCEVGKTKLQVESIAQAVRTQLESGTFESALRIRLRKFLVGMLATDLAAAAEVEAQLTQLATEDAANRPEYDLQRALLYHRTQRIDLAQSLLTSLPFGEVQSAPILQEAVEILVTYGFLRQAAEALEVVNRLLPEDVFSWERRLTLLASLNRESDFRAVVRQLRSGEANLKLRTDSVAMLDRHLQASFWRSVSRLIATGDPNRFEETLPLLASVDRENQNLTQAAWTEWTRAIVLRTLGREEESSDALERLSSIVTEGNLERIEFPDGLTLAVATASNLVRQAPSSAVSTAGINMAALLSEATVGWAFEVEPGAQIEQFGASGDRIMAIDNRGTIYSLDRKSGKLLWRESFGTGPSLPGRTRPGIFLTRPSERNENSREVKTVRPFAIGEDRVFLFSGDRVISLASLDGALLWSAQLQFPLREESPPRAGARPGTLMDLDDGKLVVFRPDEGRLLAFDALSGKQLWSAEVWKEQPRGNLTSLSAGLDVRDGRVFAYGWQSMILDAETGEPFWGFDRAFGTSFPVALRRDRGLEEGGVTGVETEAGAGSDLAGATAAESADAGATGVPPAGTWPESGAPAPLEKLVDFTRSDLTSGFLSSLENKSLSMVSPAVYWTRNRLQDGTESYGLISDGFLWLMQDDSLRRLSLRLPVASRQLPAGGTFLGVVKNHAWFLEESTLHHLDFNTERVTRIDLTDLGRNLRAVLDGNQLLVRGQVGAKVVNALTGSVIAAHSFPPELLEYLRAVVEVRPYQAGSESLWRGSAYLPENGEPRYCLPIRDTITGDGYVTQFGGNVLVSLQPAATPAAPPAASGGETSID